jgi:hypothetical protein
MGRECAQCQYDEPRHKYSRNQWLKGEGISRCFDCVGYPCSQCQRLFSTQNELNMHMQVHRERTVSCPVCGITKFKSGANAVQHVESGYCPCCPGGREEARVAIYKFAAKQRQMHRFMTDIPRLTYNGEPTKKIPDFPYHCQNCQVRFRNLSQLLQHQDNKHNTPLLLTY